MSTFVGWLFIVVSLIVGGGATIHHLLEARPRHWPSTRGKVIESIVVHDGYHIEGVPRVRYSYTVDHLHYVGERLSMGLATRLGRSTRRIVKQHPVGQVVRVFYDPEDPETAVIERPLSPEWIILVVMSVLFLIKGLLLAFNYVR